MDIRFGIACTVCVTLALSLPTPAAGQDPKGSSLDVPDGACSEQGGDGRTGAAAGVVEVARAGVRAPSAVVSLTWTEDGGATTRTTRTRTDEDGAYEICRIPTDRMVAGRASFLNMQSVRREFRLADEESPFRLDFEIGRLESGRIRGEVREHESGRAVAAADVHLLGTSFHQATDDRGAFQFSDVPPGDYRLRVSHIGYLAREQHLELSSAADVRLSIDVSSQPVELDSIRVEGTGEGPDAVYLRSGTVITREEIDAVRGRSTDVGDLLENRHSGGLVIEREGTGVCAGFSSGQARLWAFRTGSCQSAIVFIDGARASRSEVALQLSAKVVDRIILIRPARASTLFGPGASNGAILIYTRSADPRDR